MWKTDSIGVARWALDDIAWSFRAVGGEQGIQIAGPDRIAPRCRFEPVGEDRLPIAGDHYVRHDQWHVDYPQGDRSYGLNIVFTPIEATPKRLVLETTLSIQTSLLDTHPTLDLCAGGTAEVRTIGSGEPSSGQAPPAASTDRAAAASAEPINSSESAAPIHLIHSQGGWVAVLLGPHDYPFAQNRSRSGELRLRLFGEFLEKGVIRKGRPWIVIDRSGEEPRDSELTARWNQLCESPLPLMA